MVVNIVGRSFARDAFAQALSAEAFVRAMLDFERALAGAEADAGVIPPEAARVIARACTDLNLSPEALAIEGKRSGSLAVPLVSAVAVKEHRHLRDVAVAARPSLAGQIHDVFSLEAIVTELAPVLDEALAGVAGEG